MNAYLAELIGTAIILVFGAGVVANVVLARTKGGNSGWIVIAWGWAIAVFVGVFVSQDHSGAHLNPAVTVGLAVAGRFPWAQVTGYICAQLAGAFIGAAIVGVFYRAHFVITDDLDAKLGVFCTAPALRSLPQAFVCEAIGTFFLVFPVLMMGSASVSLPALAGAVAQDAPVGLGSLGALPVALLVLGLGLALGGTTGYAINPARDLGPRVAHAVLPLGRKRDGDWSYAWIPVLGPLAGGVLAALVALAVG